jgi:hypothetical protein
VVRVGADGFESSERAVMAASQVRETWTATLRPLDVPPSARQRRFRIAGQVLLGAAGAAAIPAITFIALDGRPYPLRCHDLDADGDCRRIYRTLPHGGVLLGVSVALAAVGGALLTISRRSGRRKTAWLRYHR